MLPIFLILCFWSDPSICQKRVYQLRLQCTPFGRHCWPPSQVCGHSRMLVSPVEWAQLQVIISHVLLIPKFYITFCMYERVSRLSCRNRQLTGNDVTTKKCFSYTFLVQHQLLSTKAYMLQIWPYERTGKRSKRVPIWPYLGNICQHICYSICPPPLSHPYAQLKPVL